MGHRSPISSNAPLDPTGEQALTTAGFDHLLRRLPRLPAKLVKTGRNIFHLEDSFNSPKTKACV